MANVQYYGTGRRKHSVARVRLVAGEGNIIINGRAVEEYFNYETLIRDVKQPLVLTNNENKYDVMDLQLFLSKYKEEMNKLVEFCKV